jgi:dTDP-L-rhamnose 4-epimerase
MKVLVTGGAGFIGSYVCDALLHGGHAVRVLDNLDAQVHGPERRWPDYLAAGVERQMGDVRNAGTVASALKGCDAVIHLAAAVGVGQSMYEIERYSSINVIGTAVLLEEIIKQQDHIGKLIVASSMSIYGEGAYRSPSGEISFPSTRPAEQLKRGQWDLHDTSTDLLYPIPTSEDKPCKPESVYAINKRDQEELCLSVGKAYGIPTVALRMFNVYGARQALSNPYTGVVAIFSARLMNGQPPLIFEDGDQRRDFVQVEDVAQAYLRALESPAADGLALNVGSGRSISVRQIAEALARVLHVEVQPVVTGKYREGDIRHCFADISRIQQRLAWKPRWDMDSGLSALLEWLKSQKTEDHVKQAYGELEARGLLK